MKVVSFIKNNRIKVVALTLIAVVVMSLVAVMNARADLKMDANELVTVHVSDGEIPNGYLAIGVHLIYLGSLTQELYDLAVDSGADFQQYDTYYKSELSGGTWYNITDAYSLSAITTEGSPVSKTVIENLEFMYKTNEQGITIDLLTNEVVDLFSLVDPYDLEAMKELEPLKIQYNMLNGKIGDNLTDSDEIYLELIEDFFGMKAGNAESDQWDRGLNALEWYRRICIKNGKPSAWKDTVGNIGGQVDATRRVIAFDNIAKELSLLLEIASGQKSMITPAPSPSPEVTPEPDEDEGIEGLEVNTAIVEAIGECIQNIATTRNSYAGKMLDEGTTISSKKRFSYVKELISNAISSNESGCDVVITNIVNLDNVNGHMKVNGDSEYETIANDVIKTAYQQFAAALFGGVGSDYQTAKAEGQSQAALNQHLTEQKASTKAIEAEYETFLEAMFDRMENSSAQQVTLKLIDNIPQMKSSVKDDEIKNLMLDVIDDHRDWLQSEYSKLLSEGEDNSEKAKLQSEYDELSEARNQALNENDLGTAADLEAQMLAKKTDMDNLDAKYVNILNDPNSSEADRARAKAGLGDSSVANLATLAGSELAANIRAGGMSKDELESQLATLAAVGELDPEAAKAALEEVQAALDSTGTELDVSGVNDGIDKGIENGSGTLSRDSMMALLESLLGTDFDKASSQQQAAAILALEWYGDRKNYSEAYVLAGSLATNVQGVNPYIYNKFTGNSQEYIPVSCLAGILKYRYIFDDKLSTATMQKAKAYYTYTSGSDQYKMTGDVNKKLKSKAELGNRDLYISSTDSKGIYSIKVRYMNKVSLGLGYDGTCETMANEMLELLLQGGM